MKDTYKDSSGADYIGKTVSATKSIILNTIPPYAPSNYTLPLYKGWNFIASPKILERDSDTFAIFNTIDTAHHSIWEYDTVNQSWMRKYPADRIKPLYGYWIYSNSPATVLLPFSTDPLRTPSSRLLSPGWNTIGFTGMYPLPARDALIAVRDSWTQAMGFDAVSQNYEIQMINNGSGNFSDMRQMYVGKGYWVYMTGTRYIGVLGL
jgi:hypothetical protein